MAQLKVLTYDTRPPAINQLTGGDGTYAFLFKKSQSDDFMCDIRTIKNSATLIEKRIDDGSLVEHLQRLDRFADAGLRIKAVYLNEQNTDLLREQMRCQTHSLSITVSAVG